MKRFNLIILSLLCISGLLVGIVGAEVALLKNTYKGSETGTISPVMALTFKIDGVTWANNSAIPSWGTNLLAGQTVTKSISITNVGNVPVASITLAADPSTPLPSGWTETISALTVALAPGATATGTISLTPPVTATFGSYSWNTIITATQ